MFESRVLRRIFGPKSYEMMGGWGEFHSKEFHNYQIKDAIGEACSMYGEMTSVYKILVGKPEGKRPF
jgi:hypothetical protein